MRIAEFQLDLTMIIYDVVFNELVKDHIGLKNELDKFVNMKTA